ncbi:hypothetical protein MNB_ARC-1_234 [hydrothermal vent metagenome]|uniref:Outer membrane protein beta-barrel domain-containing protein n=1 Tax=hydrothermal vent metagenome TaxID=652676 RepID=A0A3B1DXB0_9ZZZZ
MKKIILGISFVVSSIFAYDDSSSVTIRPHFGYGTNSTQHYGLKILKASNANQAYGLEVTRFTTNIDQFTAVGIILEERSYSWFHSSIGTVGYFNYEANNQNIIGLTSNLGWEPHSKTLFKPFIAYRNDVIFAKRIRTIHSISIGLRF